MCRKTSESIIILIVFSLMLWVNWADGQTFPDKPFARLGKGTISQVAYSPDGKLLAVAGSLGIWLYDADSLTEVDLLEGAASYLVFSPDGRLMASGGTDHAIHLWDVQQRKQIGILQDHSVISVAAFSPDGKTLVSVSRDSTVRLWDVERQEQIRVLQGQNDIVALSPDGKILAWGSWNSDTWNTISLWDIETQQQIGELTVLWSPSIYPLAFSPDGKTLAFGSWDPSVGLWDVQEQKMIGILALEGPSPATIPAISSAVFSPDGKLLAFPGLNTIHLWDVARQEQVGTLNGSYTPTVFSPDGKTLASRGVDNTVRFWDIQEQKQVGSIREYTSIVTSLAFSPDGRLLAAGGGSALRVDGSVCLWDIQTQKQVGRLEHPYWNFMTYFRASSVAFSSDGKFLASAWPYQPVHLWDVQEQRQVALLEGSTPVAFSPEGDILATGVIPLVVPVAPAKSHDEPNWPAVRLWNVKTQQLLGEIVGDMSLHPSSLSPDGKLLALLGGKGVSLWDVETQKHVGSLQQGHVDFVSSLAFSPDGKTLASGGRDKRICLWDIETRNQVGELLGHTGWVSSLAFSPDGRWLASGSGGLPNMETDGTIRLWDLGTQKHVELLTEDTGEIYCIAFSPDWEWLATGMSDGTILLWRSGIDIPVMMEPKDKLITTMGKVKSTMLLQNFPNPFNPETWIPYSLAEDSPVTLGIYDIQGQLVRKFALGQRLAGTYIDKGSALYWDGRNTVGEPVSSGVYFYQLITPKFRQVKRMVVLR